MRPRKGKIIQCITCKKEFYTRPYNVGKKKFCSGKCYGEYLKIYPHNYWKGKKRPIETREKISESHIGKMKGEHHWNWKGGKSKEYKHQTGTFRYKKWRMDVFLRDNFTCQFCGIRGVYLTAHHIKSWTNYPELRFSVDNGITLCENCHKLTDNYKGRNKNKNI